MDAPLAELLRASAEERQAVAGAVLANLRAAAAKSEARMAEVEFLLSRGWRRGGLAWVKEGKGTTIAAARELAITNAMACESADSLSLWMRMGGTPSPGLPSLL